MLTVKMSRRDFDALPTRDFYGPPPEVGTRFKTFIPELLWEVHEGRRVMLGHHLPPDVLSPKVGDHWTSRMSWRYVDILE